MSIPGRATSNSSNTMSRPRRSAIIRPSWSSIISPASARSPPACRCSPGWRRRPRPCGSAPRCWCCPGTIRCCSPSRPRPSICSPAAGSISAPARAIATTNSPASACRSRKPTRASTSRSTSSSNPGRRSSASRTRANTGSSRTSSSSRRPRKNRIRRSGWAPAARIRSSKLRRAAITCCSISSPRSTPSPSASPSTRRRWNSTAACSTRRMSASPAPSMWPRMPPTRKLHCSGAWRRSAASRRFRARRA